MSEATTMAGRHRLASTNSLRCAFSLVELLVTIAIVAALVALLLPAIDSAREAARAATCRAHLRSMALATLHHESARSCFPPARLVPAAGTTNAAPSATWLVRLMPYLEEGAAARAWDDSKPYDQQEEAARAHVVDAYLCPTRRSQASPVTAAARTPDRFAACGCVIPGRIIAGGAVADFGGNHGDSPPGATGVVAVGSGVIVTSEHVPGTSRWAPRLRPTDITDGLAHTLLAGEMHVPRGRLSVPPDNGPAYDATDFFTTARVGGPGVTLGDGPDDDVAGMGLFAFGGWHFRVCHMAFADGRIESLATAVASDTLASLCDRSDAVP